MKNLRPLILLLLIIVAGCSGQNPSSDPRQVSYSTPEPSKTELTRQTVLSLAKERISENVIGKLRHSSNSGGGNMTDVYDEMINDKLIRCAEKEPYVGGCGCWTGCVPGENNHGLADSNEALYFSIGGKFPSEVTGISRIDQNTAEADIILTFEPNEDAYAIFNKYSTAFWSNNLNQGSRRHVRLKLYDDGWRLDN